MVIPYEHRIVILRITTGPPVLVCLAFAADVVLQCSGDVVGVAEVKRAGEVEVVQNCNIPGLFVVLLRFDFRQI